MISWLLTTPVQQSYGAGSRFMASRGGGTRYHCGLDIIAAEGAVVLAPEPLTVIDVNRGWDGTAKATLVHTESGFSLLLGCTALDSAPPEGTHLQAGEMVAKVGYYTKKGGEHSSMLHLQCYGTHMTPAQVNKAQSWYQGSPVPDGLIDPEAYLDDGVEPAPQNAPNDAPAGPAVQADGALTEAAPCPMVNGQMVCLLNQVTAWYTALLAYWDAGTQVLQLSYTLIDAGKLKWTPAASAAVAQLDQAAALLTQYEQNALPGLPNEQVKALVAGCQKAKAATATLQAFNASAGGQGPVPDKSRGGGGAGLLIGGGILAAGAVATVAYMSRRKRRAA